jgi:hypothetical protein
MNKLLFALIIVTSAASLQGMDHGSDRYTNPPQPLSPWKHMRKGYSMKPCYIRKEILDGTLSSIILIKIYHQLSKFCPREIAQYIITLRLKASKVDLAQFLLKIKQNYKYPEVFVQLIDELIKLYGYNPASELFKQFFTQANRSVWDIKDTAGKTALSYARDYTNAAKLLLDTAGDNAWTLLTMQDINGDTALHCAAFDDSCVETVKLFFNAAGNNVWTLLTMQNDFNETALHCAADHNSTEIIDLLLNAAGNRVEAYKAMETTDGRTALGFNLEIFLKKAKVELERINNHQSSSCLIS